MMKGKDVAALADDIAKQFPNVTVKCDYDDGYVSDASITIGFANKSYALLFWFDNQFSRIQLCSNRDSDAPDESFVIKCGDDITELASVLSYVKAKLNL